jgi:hypothetical protein
LTTIELLTFLRAHRYAVEASVRVFPDGRDRLAWPNLIHLRVRPRWMRYSDFAVDPPLIVEMTAEQIGRRW